MYLVHALVCVLGILVGVLDVFDIGMLYLLHLRSIHLVFSSPNISGI